MKAVTWTRVFRFCAGHRLFHPDRDDSWNRNVFGKCSTPGGHGHNYELEVSVRGEPDPDTGRVIPPGQLEAVVKAEVMDRLDHRNLNDVLSADYGPAPTTEVLVLELWRALEGKVRTPVKLYRIKVSETAKNSFEYFGPEKSTADL
jgi:6-pyruvoyltetrahydropterin/6-carboxytetrahydropterin synthase